MKYDRPLIRLLLDQGADLDLARENAKDKEVIDSLLRQINYKQASSKVT